MARTNRTALVMAVTGGAYFLAALVGGALSSAGSFATLWPPNGVLVAILLRSDVRLWPYLVLACWPANFAFNQWQHQPALLSHAYWMVNMAESLAVAAIVRRAHGRVTLERVREIGTFLGVATAGAMLGALVGAGVTLAWHGGAGLADTWRSWLMSDLLGMLIVAPVIVTFPWARVDGEPAIVTNECIVFGAVCAAVTVVDLVLPGLGVRPANFLFPVTVPLVGWAALRLGVPGTSWAVLVSSLLIVLNHVRGVGELVGPQGFTPDRAVILQAILSGLAMTFLSVAAAVSENRVSARRLLERDASRQALIAAMTHEIRNPLTVILASLELADRPADAAAAGVDPLDAIERSARQILETVEDTLELSRAEADAARRQELWLPAFWRELHADCSTMGRLPAVVLRWKSPAPDVSIVTDRGRLTTIIRNLVRNAVKFTDRGHVSVDCRVDGDDVTFVVEDSGIGIPPGDVERIFELYQRGSDAHASRRAGTGIGLYLVRRYAEECGGTVRVRSVPGQGSTFTVTFPNRAAVVRVA